MKIEKMKVAELRGASYNPREDLLPGDPRFEKLRRSIEEFGFVEPLVWNKRTGNLVGGHQRLQVLKSQKIEEVDVVVVDMADAQEKALNIALNKISGDWDLPKLRECLVSLDDGATDVTLTGFDRKEFEKMIDVEGESQEDKYPEMELQPFENYDYVMIPFRNSMDWLKAVEILGLKKVAVKVKDGQDKIGLCRVLDGAKFLEMQAEWKCGLKKKDSGKKSEKAKAVGNGRRQQSAGDTDVSGTAGK